jgi:hypothetical protein
MTRFQALVIAGSFFVPVVVGLFLLVANYFDNRAAAKQLRQKQADAMRATNPALPLTDLSEAEREQLKLHIETLEAFAETVKNAGAVVEESSRRVHMTTPLLSVRWKAKSASAPSL